MRFAPAKRSCDLNGYSGAQVFHLRSAEGLNHYRQYLCGLVDELLISPENSALVTTRPLLSGISHHKVEGAIDERRKNRGTTIANIYAELVDEVARLPQSSRNVAYHRG